MIFIMNSGFIFVACKTDWKFFTTEINAIHGYECQELPMIDFDDFLSQ